MESQLLHYTGRTLSRSNFWIALALLAAGPLLLVYQELCVLQGQEWPDLSIRLIWSACGGIYPDFQSADINNIAIWLLKQPLSMASAILGAAAVLPAYRHL